MRSRSRKADTRALIRDFLYCTESLPREEAASIAGVSVAAVTRWAVCPPSRLRRLLRERLLAFLGASTSRPGA